MATAKIFPKTSQVSGTHSNMPLLLIPSEVTDIGSLTLAEAQSIRIYTDASLTTEVAREVVSADEIHFKAPSASSSMEFWVDWDGARADYAVGATYGRNNVWSDYELVAHLESSSFTDVTGNGNDGTNNGTTLSADAPFGAGSRDFTSDFIDFGRDSSLDPGTDDWTFQIWFKLNSTAQRHRIIDRAGPDHRYYMWVRSDSSPDEYDQFISDNPNSARNRDTASFNTTDWVMSHSVVDRTTKTLYLYEDGAEFATDYDATMDTWDITDPNQADTCLGRSDFYATTQSNFKAREFRIARKALSADWISTEYNNQNDNAAFWDSEPVAATTFTPRAIII